MVHKKNKINGGKQKMKVLEMNPNVMSYRKKKATELFKKGDELEVKITGVQPFGAFGVIIVENIEYTTLTHRTIINPQDKDVEPERHFRNGDIVKGVVQGFDKKGNMSLSTTAHFDTLPDYFNPKELKEEVKQASVTALSPKETNAMTEEEAEVIYQQVKPTLESTLSVISAESEQLFKQIIRESGVVEFCLSLGKIAPTFNIDPGLILAEAIQNDIRGCL